MTVDSASEPERRTFHTLDGLRGAAALSIVVLHTPRFFGGWHLVNSYLAVDLFFALSGIVLAHAYEHRFENGLGLSEFLVKRLVRLYPLYLVSTALGFVVACLSLRYGGGSVTWSPNLLALSLPFSLMFLPTPPLDGSDFLYPLNPVLWSLFFEVGVNIVYRAGWRLFRSTEFVLVVVLVAAVGVTMSAQAFKSIDTGYGWSNFLGGAARVFYSFFVGVLFFRVQKLRNHHGFVAAILVLLVPILFYLGAENDWVYPLLCVLVLIPALVFAAMIFEPSPMVFPVFTMLGSSSYAIYVLHKPVYQLFLAGLIKFSPVDYTELAPWLGIAYLVVLVPVCIVVDRAFDQPNRKRLARLFSGNPVPQI